MIRSRSLASTLRYIELPGTVESVNRRKDSVEMVCSVGNTRSWSSHSFGGSLSSSVVFAMTVLMECLWQLVEWKMATAL